MLPNLGAQLRSGGNLTCSYKVGSQLGLISSIATQRQVREQIPI
jgi:hypothetical protein